MIRKIMLLLCLWAGVSLAQDRYVLRDSIFTSLDSVDVDTLYWLFAPSQIPMGSHMLSDTTRAGVTRFIPPNYARTAGSYDLWLNRTNVTGTADSFRVYYFPLDPWSGFPAANDSTFVVGTASTFADIAGTALKGSRYVLSIYAGMGVGLVIRQGDTSSDTTRVRATLIHTQ